MQEITGVFMKNCTLNYGLYRNTFPIWALAEYRRRVLFAWRKASAYAKETGKWKFAYKEIKRKRKKLGKE